MSIENHDPTLLSHNMQAFTSTSSFTSGAIPMSSEAVTIGGFSAKLAYEISAIHTISASYPYDQCNQTHRVNT